MCFFIESFIITEMNIYVTPKPEPILASGIKSTMLWAFLIACAILTPVLQRVDKNKIHEIDGFDEIL